MQTATTTSAVVCLADVAQYKFFQCTATTTMSTLFQIAMQKFTIAEPHSHYALFLQQEAAEACQDLSKPLAEYFQHVRTKYGAATVYLKLQNCFATKLSQAASIREWHMQMVQVQDQ